ncbi:glycosyltransferase family 2 protein [Symbioplanes lichenis]|uniref:glycosyltransferase family 2 protein n=1 Tax=Symbioplanes lichenis TaxID=1629072 RepID=UPI002738E1FF|nr:glycosyltransferase family 2 protein [Actinoplanes lichenis]
MAAQVTLVSVVIPTRDRPELLRRAIDAVTAQEHDGPIEVVVVYDRSTPDLTPARSSSDRTVRVLVNDRKPGLAGARNTGILAAQGDFVGFCDDDDEWLPGKLKAQLAALEATGGDFACCGIRVTYDGTEFDRVLPLDRIPLAALLRDRMTELHPSTFLMRASALHDGIGLVDEEIPGSYAEDYEFLLRAARHAPLVNVREPGTIVRWHRSSYFSQRWQTISSALRWLLERYPEFEQEPAGLARVAGQIAFAEAAQGRSRAAAHWARRTLAGNSREPRAYLAMAVAGRLIRPGTVVRILHKRGRGI